MDSPQGRAEAIPTPPAAADEVPPARHIRRPYLWFVLAVVASFLLGLLAYAYANASEDATRSAESARKARSTYISSSDYERRASDYFHYADNILVATVLTTLLATVLFEILVFRFWKVLRQEGEVRVSPAAAVGLQFVPFFHFYWLFVVLGGLASGLNRVRQRRGLAAPPVPVALAALTALLLGLAFAPLLGVVAVPIANIVSLNLKSFFAPLPAVKQAAGIGRGLWFALPGGLCLLVLMGLVREAAAAAVEGRTQPREGWLGRWWAQRGLAGKVVLAGALLGILVRFLPGSTKTYYTPEGKPSVYARTVGDFPPDHGLAWMAYGPLLLLACLPVPRRSPLRRWGRVGLGAALTALALWVAIDIQAYASKEKAQRGPTVVRSSTRSEKGGSRDSKPVPQQETTFEINYGVYLDWAALALVGVGVFLWGRDARQRETASPPPSLTL